MTSTKLFFDVGDAQYFSEVTADHPLLAEDLCSLIEAGELPARGKSKLPRLVGGDDSQSIVDIQLATRTTLTISL